MVPFECTVVMLGMPINYLSEIQKCCDKPKPMSLKHATYDKKKPLYSYQGHEFLCFGRLCYVQRVVLSLWSLPPHIPSS